MPVKSMTAFSRGEKNFEKIRLYVEIRSVNGRYLDSRISGPNVYNLFQNRISKLICQKFSRGTFDVFVRREVLSGDYLNVVLNRVQSDRAHSILQELRSVYKVRQEVVLADFLHFEVISSGSVFSDSELEYEWECLEEVLLKALSELHEMRLNEGAHLWKDIEGRLNLIRGYVQEIESRYKKALPDYTLRISERLSQVIKQVHKNLPVNAEDPRFQLEIGYIAERCDITEELTRLRAHIQGFAELGVSVESVGRKMDFLLQEMNREINTIASKNIDSEAGAKVIFAKAEIEKIRQQVQNIE